jgi:nucleotide-binding universal stress UspA family protein
MYKHILLPTDGSPISRKAVAAGVKLARALGARVTGFYAAPPATPLEFKGFLPVGYTDPEKHARAIEKAAASHLAVVEKAAQAAGVRCKAVYETNDFPAEAIVAAAKKNGCDLIYMGSHGRSGRKSSLLGSHTQKVLSLSPVPVLVDR